MLAPSVVLLALAASALGDPIEFNRLALFPTGGRIVGGVAAAEGEVPWQVSLQSAGGSQSCGGSIISKDWIVTAAHCSRINPKNYRVRSGTLRYSEGGVVHNIAQVVRHPLYNDRTTENDIAVWKVDPPFEWDTNTGAVNLPPQGAETKNGTVLWVSGWGTTSSGGSVSPDLLKVDVPVVDKQTCNKQYSSIGGIPPNQICAGLREGQKDSCQGDSGGPLYLAETSTLLGVVSWGNGCALPNYPGVYTEVASYRNWINLVTGV